jgi:hypothetical protein
LGLCGGAGVDCRDCEGDFGEEGDYGGEAVLERFLLTAESYFGFGKRERILKIMDESLPLCSK